MAEDQKVVQLNPDQTEYVLKEIGELYSEVAYLSSEFRHSRLTEEMRSTVCSLMEYRLARINKTLGYYGDLNTEMERRSEELRNANMRARNLEKLVGSTRPLDGFAQLLQHLQDELRSFWREHGFGHVSDVDFTGYGIIKVKYGFFLDKHMWSILPSETPATDRKNHAAWIRELSDAGYVLVTEEGDREYCLLDCDQNRRLITDLLTARYPSLHIFKWENIPLHKCAGYPHGSRIFGLEVTIKDVKDIPNKPESGQGEQPEQAQKPEEGSDAL